MVGALGCAGRARQKREGFVCWRERRASMDSRSASEWHGMHMPRSDWNVLKKNDLRTLKVSQVNRHRHRPLRAGLGAGVFGAAAGDDPSPQDGHDVGTPHRPDAVDLMKQAN